MNDVRLARLVTAALLTLVAGLVGCGGRSADSSLDLAKKYRANNDLPAATIELKNALQSKPDMPEARFLLGKTLLEREEPVAAVVELRKATELKYAPDLVTPVLAKALLLSGQFRKVIELGESASITNVEAVAELKTQVAWAYGATDQAEKSRAALNAALQAKPDHAPALLLRARVLAAAQDLDQATRIADQVLAGQPGDVDALLLKGDLLQARNDIPGSAALYRKVLALRPDNVLAHSSLLQQLLKEGDLKAARLQLEAMHKARPNNLQTVYYQARLAAQSGDLKAAGGFVDQLLKSVPEAPQALQLAGVVAVKSNDFLKAEKHLGKLIQVMPESLNGRLLLARVQLRTGDFEQVLETLQPLLQAASPDADALGLAGTAYMLSGDSAKAEALLARAVKIKPADADSRTALALSRLRRSASTDLAELEAVADTDPGTVADIALINATIARRDFKAALKGVDRLEKKQPGKPEPPFLRGQIHFLQQDMAAARAQFERALQVDAAYFPATHGLASIDLRENKFDQARARFQARLTADPADVRSLVGLASVEQRAGASKDSVAALLTKAVGLQPSNAGVRAQLVAFYLARSDYKSALASAQDATGALPNDAATLALLAQAQMGSGDANQAVSSYTKLVAMTPRSAPALLGLAQAQMATKAYEAAGQTMKRALALAPDDGPVQQRAAEVSMASGKVDEARSQARALQTRLPKSPLGFVIEGDVELQSKNWDAAAAAYRAALKRTPRSDLAFRAHTALYKAGDQAKTQAFDAEWLKSNPADATFPFLVAGIAIAEGKFEAAADLLQQVLKIQPDNAAAHNNLAWVLMKLKRPEALDHAEKATRLAPNQPAFMDTLALLLSEGGQLPRAVELQKQVVSIEPNEHGYRLQLAQLQLKAGDKSSARKELDILQQLGEKFARQGEVHALQAQL